MASIRYLAVPLGFLLGAACAPVEEGEDFDRGLTSVPAGGSTETQPRLEYPAPPYGTQEGDIMPNFQFLGWSRPVDASFDTASLETVSLADSYDPDGSKGVRALVLTAGAVWCTVCQYEYEEFGSGVVREYERNGVNFMGTLFEDINGRPARPKDLQNWAEKYDVNFPFVLDPALELGAFFDVEATPMSMVVDARTMQIRAIVTGWSEDGLWSIIDSVLAE